MIAKLNPKPSRYTKASLMIGRDIDFHENEPEDTNFEKGLLLLESCEKFWKKNSIDEAITAYVGLINNRNDPTRDADYMKKFVALNDRLEEQLNIEVKGVHLKKWLSHEAPLMAFIYAEQSIHLPGWQYPSPLKLPLTLDWGMVAASTTDRLQYREITIAESIPDIGEMIEWVKCRIEETKQRFEANFISVDVESVMIDAASRATITPELVSGKVNFLLARYKIKGSPLPVRIMFGDGINWMFTIRLPIVLKKEKACGNRKAYFMAVEADPQLGVLLESLPTLVGRGILKDREDIQMILSIFKLQVKLPPMVDIATLALWCGWDLSKTSLFALNFIATGKIMNKAVSEGDGLWHLPISELPRSLRQYLVGDVRSGYVSTVTLLTLTVRNIFPDPACICYALDAPQNITFTWVCELLLQTLSGLEPKNPAEWDRTSRQGLARSLTTGIKGVKVSDKVMLLSKILPKWPHITNGGPRFIQPVRTMFVFQHKILQDLNFSTEIVTARPTKIIDVAWTKFVTFGRGPKFFTTGIVTSGPSLRSHPECMGTMAMLHNEEGEVTLELLAHPRLAELAKESKVDISHMIREYASVYPQNIPAILKLLNSVNLQTREFIYYLKRSSLYDDLRQIYLYVFDRATITVPAIAAEVRGKVDRILNLQQHPRWGVVTARHEDRAYLLQEQQARASYDGSTQSERLRTLYRQVPVPRYNAQMNKYRRVQKRARINQRLQDGSHQQADGPVLPSAFAPPEDDLRAVLNQRSAEAPQQDDRQVILIDREDIALMAEARPQEEPRTRPQTFDDMADLQEILDYEYSDSDSDLNRPDDYWVEFD